MGLDVVRRATDEAVVDAVLAAGRLTRAELSTAAGVSKPTASESVRRLADQGILVEAGRQEGGRGRVGTYYRVDEAAGLALAVHAVSGSMVGECVAASGEVAGRVERAVGATIGAARLVVELDRVVADLERAAGRSVVDRVVSIADPVDLHGRLVHLPGSPFVLGDADLRAALGPGAVIDNDVNWAARAQVAASPEAPSFLYVHLGAGLGAAVVDAGRVVRGRGVAGEIGHVPVRSRGAGGGGSAGRGAAATLLDALAATGLFVPGSHALDVERVRARLVETPGDVLAPLADALATCVGLLDPALVVVGGPWAADALSVGLASAVAARSPRPAELRPDEIPHAPLVGARLRARDLARAALLGSS